MGSSEKNKTIIQPSMMARKMADRVRSFGRAVKQSVSRSPKLSIGIAVGAVVLVAAGAVAVMGMPDWEALDDMKATVGAKPTLAELAQKAKAEPKNAEAQVELGHAQFEAGQRGPALRSYDRALQLDKSVASSRMIDNLIACFSEKEENAAQAIISTYKLVDAEDQLRTLTSHKQWSTRTAALKALDKLDKAKPSDSLRVYALDLQTNDCEVKRRAVAKLGELGDKRALDDIRNAKKKEAEETPWYAFSCLGGRADDAEAKILASR